MHRCAQYLQWDSTGGGDLDLNPLSATPVNPFSYPSSSPQPCTPRAIVCVIVRLSHRPNPSHSPNPGHGLLRGRGRAGSGSLARVRVTGQG